MEGKDSQREEMKRESEKWWSKSRYGGVHHNLFLDTHESSSRKILLYYFLCFVVYF